MNAILTALCILLLSACGNLNLNQKSVLKGIKLPEPTPTPKSETPADPEAQYPRVYLHYDYMEKENTQHSHKPNEGAIHLVMDAFKAQGVILDVDPVHHIIPEVLIVSFNPETVQHLNPDQVFFYDLKNLNFTPRNQDEHYVIFAHFADCGTPEPCTGQSNGSPSLDSILSLGALMDQGIALTDALVAEALLHELKGFDDGALIRKNLGK